MTAGLLTIGRWTLHERIGAGRLAHVHRATGEGGEAAVKLLAPGADGDDPAAVARFEREIAALATVRHPAVLPLLDHGVDPELGPFLVTPLVRGRTLRRLVAEGPTEPALAALVAREIAGGLAAIHAAGLVHRDLKPENVMIGDDGTVRVIDLGLAWSAHQTRYTEEGTVAGSVPYMAPEQIEGGEPGPATDVWALGVILHEWITGTRPFARGQPGEEVAAILAALPPRLADLDPRVPPELGALVAECLRRDPAERPPGGAALAARLAAIAPGDAAAALRDPAAFAATEAERQAAALVAEARRLLDAGRPFAAAPLIERALRHRPGDPAIAALVDEVGRAPAPRLRWPWLVAGAAAIAAASATIAIWVTRPAGGGPPPIDAGPPPLTAAELPEQAPVDPVAMEQALWYRSKPILPLDPRLGATDTFLMGSREAEVTASDDPEVARAYARELFGSSTRGAEAERVLAAALAKFPDHAPLWLLRAEASARLGGWEEADAALDRALALDPALAGAWVERARIHRLHGRLRAAFEAVEAGLAAAPDDPDLLLALVRLYIAAGRGPDARPIAERVTELAPEDDDAWIALADLSSDREAWEHLGRAVRLHPGSAQAWKRLCILGVELQRPEATHDCYQARVKGLYDDPELAIAESRKQELAGDLEGARSELWGSKHADDHLPMVLRLADLNERLGSGYEASRARTRACELGHQASCDRAGTADGGL